jgi:iron complex transport system substrate-binding protein
MRVVSHTCSNTEIVCALGCADLLVGVDDHSDYPVEVVRNLPRIGPDLAVDVKRVKALKPDLVLTSLTVPGHEKIIEVLQAERLPLLFVEPISLNDVYSDIVRIADALGASKRGQALVSEMREQAADIGGTPQSRPSILVEWWPKPVIVPGKYSWVSDMIAAVGARNPWGERECKSTPITDEEAIATAPDAVVLSWCGVAPDKVRPDIVRKREAWRHLPALTNNRIYCVPEAWMGRPGPRLIEGMRALRSIVTEAAPD